MNTASSLTPSIMEDPFTDTMEMASPYQGHVDDFEIDIDIMEDQPTIDDNDFDLRDASPERDLPHDADMMEDVPEVTVTEPSRYNADSNMQYTAAFYPNQESYESEMFDEELNIPSEQRGVVEETTQSVKAPSTHEEEIPDQQYSNIEENIKGATAVKGIIDQETTEQEANVLAEDASNLVTEPAVEIVPEPHPEHLIDNADISGQTINLESNTSIIEKSAEIHPAEEAHSIENGTSPNIVEAHEEVETEPDTVTEALAPYLHPVKVIYQESEISMFPPRDGDVSETYFLANEGLAHESIYNLLKECRTILGNHASPEDSLVFSIDSLGIELSDVS
jgi:hypothetical protein